MNNFKVRGKCSACKKTKWFVRARSIKLPVGPVATSRERICNKCYRELSSKFTV